MRLIFTIPDDQLPAPFAKGDNDAGLENILSFLHKNLVCRPIEDATDNVVHEYERKAFYDQQGLNGQAHVDAIRMHAEADIALGRLLLNNLKVER
jgi:hypothetical protein